MLLKNEGAVLKSVLLTKNSSGKKIEQAQKETLSFIVGRRGKVVREICGEMKANFLSRFPSQRTGSAFSGAFENWRLSLGSYWSVELTHVPFYCRLKYLSQKKALSRNTAGGFQCHGNLEDSHGILKTSSPPSGIVGF